MSNHSRLRLTSIGLPGWIAVGAVLGIATGLFLGDAAAVLQPVGTAYVMMLEAVVYPYIISSLLYGLGSLAPAMAFRLLKRSWPFYLIAWGSTLAAAYLLSLALPGVPAPDSIDGTQVADNAAGLLNIILPSNIFLDLARNHVPAVVLLSILFGVALQHLPNKEGLMSILDLIRKAGVRIWGWIVYFAPPAVFAMFAETAGTIRIQSLDTMLLYLALFLIGTFLLAFWGLPGLVACLVPGRYKDIINDLRGAFLLSMVTTLSVVALPFIQQAASKLAEESGIEDENREDIISTCLAVNYPLGQLGNFFVYFFILFAAVNFGATLSLFKSIALPFITLISCVGSPTSTVNAVDFLSSWLGLHGNALPLYIETMVVTRYGQVALSVTGFAFLTILMTQSYFGKLRIRPWNAAGHCGLVVIALVILTLGGKGLSPESMHSHSLDYGTFELTRETTKGVYATICNDPDTCHPIHEPTVTSESVFERILRTETLRVGYHSSIIPFCYRNDKGDLVGYDVACAYDLARSLNVKLEFVPLELDQLHEGLTEGAFDIAMSGLYITPERLRWSDVSTPYYQSPIALIVPSVQAQDFIDMENISNMDGLNVVSFNDPVLEPLLKRVFPFADLGVVGDYGDLPQRPDVDAAVWTFCQARSFASTNDGFTAVRPRNLNEVMVFGYFLPSGAGQMQRYVNHWIELRELDGTLDRVADYWIHGNKPGNAIPRWSIMRNVLHWGEDE